MNNPVTDMFPPHIPQSEFTRLVHNAELDLRLILEGKIGRTVESVRSVAEKLIKRFAKANPEIRLGFQSVDFAREVLAHLDVKNESFVKLVLDHEGLAALMRETAAILAEIQSDSDRKTIERGLELLAALEKASQKEDQPRQFDDYPFPRRRDPLDLQIGHLVPVAS